MDGLTILTDPVFSDRVSPFSWVGPLRSTKPVIQAHPFTKSDGVVLSQNHYDHLDLPSVEAIGNQARLHVHSLCKARFDSMLESRGRSSLKNRAVCVSTIAMANADKCYEFENTST